jgi:hypothetical protein
VWTCYRFGGKAAFILSTRPPPSLSYGAPREVAFHLRTALREALNSCGVVAVFDCVRENCDGQFEVARSQIEKAIQCNVPFVLKMADGNEYRVPARMAKCSSVAYNKNVDGALWLQQDRDACLRRGYGVASSAGYKLILFPPLLGG